MDKNIKAVVVAIGDELLADCNDTNGSAIAMQLKSIGINVDERLVLPDNEKLLLKELRRLIKGYDLIICCGGLGPTQDDLTRQVIAGVVKEDLIIDQPSLVAIKKRFKKMKFKMSASNEQQALKPRGADMLLNKMGSAPGFVIEKNDHYIAALPGPPRECMTMLNQQLIPRLVKCFNKKPDLSLTRQLTVCGIGESELQEVIGPIAGNHADLLLGFLIQEPGEILIKVSIIGRVSKPKKELLVKVVKAIRYKLGAAVVSGEGYSLTEVIGRKLKKNKQTLAIAESCTGGLISNRITMVPGSSAYFIEGLVTYSNSAKQRYLKVTSDQLKKYGAVSKQVAVQMAIGVKKCSGATWSLSVTGIAGPGGGTKYKPVGLVHVGICGPMGYSEHHQLNIGGGRRFIQHLTTTMALNYLRQAMEK